MTDLEETVRGAGRRSGWPWLVIAAGLLAGFLAQSEFAPTPRTALGFVLGVFAVTFLVSLAHSAWWGAAEPPEAIQDSEPEPDNPESQADPLPR